MTTQLNREIHDILNSAKQSAYLEDLYNLFTDLEEDYEEEKRHSDQEKLSSLSKIFSIQFPLFIQKTHPILFMFKNKALLEVATQYVFNNSLEVQYDLISDFPDLKYLITSEEINSSFTPDAFEEKIGYDKIQDILIEIQSFNKSDFYDDNIDNVCVKYDINKKRFDDTFIYKEKNIYLNNNIAYHNEQEKLSKQFGEASKLCHVIQSLIAEKALYSAKNNALISSLDKPINKDDFVDIIDWKLIINGNNAEIFQLLVENDNESFMLSVIYKNLELFQSQKEWIIEEQSKLNVVTDFPILIQKAVSHKKLILNLPVKNSKNKINKI